jgi:hypothetical protein
MDAKIATRMIMEWVFEKGQLGFCDKFQPYCYSEMDVVSMTSALRIFEYEIKMSRGDFSADFRNKPEKHERMKNGDSEYLWRGNKSFVPNYFYFVCPENLLPIEIIPEYSGLIYLNDKGNKWNRLYIVKDAPLIHNHSVDEKFLKLLIHKLSVKYLFKTIKKEK